MSNWARDIIAGLGYPPRCAEIAQLANCCLSAMDATVTAEASCLSWARMAWREDRHTTADKWVSLSQESWYQEQVTVTRKLQENCRAQLDDDPGNDETWQFVEYIFRIGVVAERTIRVLPTPSGSDTDTSTNLIIAWFVRRFEAQFLRDASEAITAWTHVRMVAAMLLSSRTATLAVLEEYPQTNWQKMDENRALWYWRAFGKEMGSLLLRTSYH